MDSLSPELFNTITSYLTFAELKTFSLTSRALRRLLEPRILHCIHIGSQTSYFSLYAFTQIYPEKSQLIHHLHFSSYIDECPLSSRTLRGAWYGIQLTALKLGFSPNHPLRAPSAAGNIIWDPACGPRDDLLTSATTCAALLLLSIYALPSLQCVKTSAHQPVAQALLRRYLRAPRVRVPDIPFCAGLRALKSLEYGLSMTAIANGSRSGRKASAENEWCDALEYFFGYPGLEHLVLHSLVVNAVDMEGNGKASPAVGAFADYPLRSSGVKHISFIQPAIYVAETRLLLSLPRALETFVLKSGDLEKNHRKEPMLLKDWWDALLQHRSTLRFMAMLPMYKQLTVHSRFLGGWPGLYDADGNLVEQEQGRPENDRLGSLREFECLKTLMVSMVYLVGFRFWTEDSVKIRDLLPRGLRRLILCLEESKADRSGFRLDQMALFNEIRWMVESGEWKDLELVRIFGCRELRTAEDEEWKMIVEQCRKRGVTLAYFEERASKWDGWSKEEEPFIWDLLKNTEEVGQKSKLELMCWPPNDSLYTIKRDCWQKR